MTSISDLPICVDYCPPNAIPAVAMETLLPNATDRSGLRLLAAMEGSQYVGFLGFHVSDDRVELCFVRVCPPKRGSGIERDLCLALREMFPDKRIAAKADETWLPHYLECGFQIADAPRRCTDAGADP